MQGGVSLNTKYDLLFRVNIPYKQSKKIYRFVLLKTCGDLLKWVETDALKVQIKISLYYLLRK
jgi:hypothetical protein